MDKASSSCFLPANLHPPIDKTSGAHSSSMPAMAMATAVFASSAPPAPTIAAACAPKLPPPREIKSSPPLISTAITSMAAASVLLLSSPSVPPAAAAADASSFDVYYGTAASAANYGGYGGNASKRDSAEYVYEVPPGWKERLVSKVEKGTNGTDSEFYNPRKKSEKEYLTFLAGFRSLAPVDAVLGNLALSDVALQDQIAGADAVTSGERRDDKGQLYYEYEISGAGGHSLIAVTCARNKLYAHFVTAPATDWGRDEDVLRRIHRSFHTVDSTAPAPSTE